MTSILLLTLDLVGTFAFAISGATAGVRKQLDLFAHEGPGGEKSPRKGEKDAERVLDELRRRFGDKVTRAALLRPPNED